MITLLRTGPNHEGFGPVLYLLPKVPVDLTMGQCYANLVVYSQGASLTEPPCSVTGWKLREPLALKPPPSRHVARLGRACYYRRVGEYTMRGGCLDECIEWRVRAYIGVGGLLRTGKLPPRGLYHHLRIAPRAMLASGLKLPSL